MRSLLLLSFVAAMILWHRALSRVSVLLCFVCLAVENIFPAAENGAVLTAPAEEVDRMTRRPA